MRRLAILLTLLAPLSAAWGAEGDAPFPKARLMRDGGIALTVPGALFGTLSVGMAGLAVHHNTTCEHECMGGAFAAIGSMASAVVATPFLVGGIAMWTTGNRRLEVNETTISISMLPQPGGAMGAVHVRF